jgi:hypothetical protein
MGQWSAEFNGAGSGGDSLMSIADASQTGLAPTGNFSVWFWLELLATTGHSGRYIVLKDHSTNLQYRIWFAAADGSTINIEVYETSGGTQHQRTFSGLSISQDTPTHIVLTFDASAATADDQYELFKNGTSQGNGSLVSGSVLTGTFDSDGPFQIGGGSGDTQNADNARFFDVRFYDAIVAPTTTTYKQLLASPSTESNLQLNVFRGTSDERWTCNSGSVVDASTNGNDLSITYQATADCPLEVDEWPTDAYYTAEDWTDADLVVGGPSAEGLRPIDIQYIARDAYVQEDVVDGSIGVDIQYIATDANFASFAGGGAGLEYRMRGYDTTLTQTVFWASDHVDSTAADYGGPGPVTNIVVQKKLGTV